jgi:hypothetical protein
MTSMKMVALFAIGIAACRTDDRAGETRTTSAPVEGRGVPAGVGAPRESGPPGDTASGTMEQAGGTTGASMGRDATPMATPNEGSSRTSAGGPLTVDETTGGHDVMVTGGKDGGRMRGKDGGVRGPRDAGTP